MIKLSRLEAEHILYTLNEAEAALSDPTADYEGVMDCIYSSRDILNGHFDNEKVEVMDDISEFLDNNPTPY